MRTEKLSASALATLLREADEGVPVAELLRRYGLSRATFFRLRAKHRTETPARNAGQAQSKRVGELAKCVDELEAENAELKRTCADLRRENRQLRSHVGRRD
jgi:putative transposase